jgi:hypothetical protein
MSEIKFTNKTTASVATPAAGKASVFIDDVTKKLKSKDDTGAVTDYSAASSGISALTGEGTATGPGSAVLTLTNSAVTGKVLTGLTPASGALLATDSILQAFGKLVEKQNRGFFPYGVGAIVVSSNTTLTGDVYCDTYEVQLGATVTTAGYRIFAMTSIIVDGVIERNGNDATGTAATAALVAGTTGAAGAGGAGGTAAGSAGGASATALGGLGGAGGAGSGGAGGAAGTQTLVTAANGGVDIAYQHDQGLKLRDLANTIITGGAGGGGGGGDGTAGGAGGGGAGGIVLCAREISGSGSITAIGGDGFQPVAGNRGGGGGAGGGIIVLISENDTTATSLTLSVAGGVGASGSGTGASGANGGNGRIFRVRV